MRHNPQNDGFKPLLFLRFFKKIKFFFLQINIILKDKNNCLKIKNYYFNIFPIEKKLQPLFQTPTPLNTS
jgi:hypothetical protein